MSEFLSHLREMLIVSVPGKFRERTPPNWDTQNWSRLWFRGLFLLLNECYHWFRYGIRIDKSQTISLLTENHNGDKVTALSVDCGPGDYNVGKQSYPDRQFG